MPALSSIPITAELLNILEREGTLEPNFPTVTLMTDVDAHTNCMIHKDNSSYYGSQGDQCFLAAKTTHETTC